MQCNIIDSVTVTVTGKANKFCEVIAMTRKRLTLLCGWLCALGPGWGIALLLLGVTRWVASVVVHLLKRAKCTCSQ